MTTKAQEIQDRLDELESEIEVLLGRVEDYGRAVSVACGQGQGAAPAAASGVPLPWWWNEDYPDHPDFEANKRAKVEAARAKEPVIVDASNEPVRPAGWDDPTPGNPYHPDVIAQRQADHEREVAKNRERDRAAVEYLNSPEVCRCRAIRAD